MEHFFGLLEAHDRKIKETNTERARPAYGQYSKERSKQQDRVYYECRQSGHVARECPERNQDNELQRRCVKYKKQGHCSNNCPRDKQGVGRVFSASVPAIYKCLSVCMCMRMYI